MSLLLADLDPAVPITRACQALSINRSSFYYRRSNQLISQTDREKNRSRKHTLQPRALSSEERARALRVLTSEEFADQTPDEIYQTLLERGEHICSVSTMYRFLREKRLNGERRCQRSPQRNAVPRLLASRPNQVWTWDCSKLPTHDRGVYLTLYTVLDLYSRYVLAWMVSSKENSALATQLMQEASARYDIKPHQLTIHQDRGSPMIAHRYIDMMIDLHIVLSHSRPRVSNDNPHSESQFKTLKYQPDYPGRFGNASHARQWCEEYFSWYNFHHHHEGLNGFTPEQVFTGRYRQVTIDKQAALDARYEKNPERFVRGRPTVAEPPEQVFINRVTDVELENGATDQVNFPTLNRVKEKSSLILN